MKNKVALITGASGGIGSEIARTLASAGYNLVLTYNTNKKSVDRLIEEFKEYKIDCVGVKCDISNEDEVKNMVEKSVNRFGKIDVLVNNAGIASDHLFYDKTAEIFRNTLNINLVGTFLVSKYVGEIMLNNKYGKIINITSTNGINTYFPMCLDYDASKAGIISLTHNLAIQFAPYINVNAIAPGFIATENEIKNMDEEYIESEREKIMLKRVGREKDVANLVKFLASDEASYINNEVIRIDGGIYGNY